MKLDKYIKEGTFKMPSRNIDPKRKDKAYCLNMGNAMLNMYATNQCGVPFKFGSDQRSFEELRLYADGKQPVSKYKSIFYPDGSYGQRNNKTFMNISWDNVKVMPKFLNVAQAIIMQQEWDIGIQAIDQTSQTEKQQELAYLKWKQKREFQDFKKMLGFDTPKSKQYDQKYPKFSSEEQVDIFSQAGGIRLEREIELYQLLKATDYESGTSVLNLKFVKDLLTIGFVASETMPDPITRKVLKKYVDPARLICRYSDYPDHRDIDFAGYIEEMTVAQIREYNPLSGDPLSEPELMSISKEYSSEFGNIGGMNNISYYNQRAMEDYYSRFQCYPYDAHRISVATLYWIDQDVEKFTEMKNPKYNSTMRNKVDYNYKVKPEEAENGKVIETYKPTKTRFVKFIVGTSQVIDYGVLDYSPRDYSQNSFLSRLPIQIFRLDQPSLVDMCVTHVDDIQISTLKLRDARAKMPPPPRMIINKDAVTNLTVGGVKMQPSDAVELLTDAGYTYVKYTDDHGNPNVNTKAFDFLPTGFSEDFAIWTNDINNSMQQIASQTGINDITSGQTPKRDTLVGVAEIAVQASNNALFNIINAVKEHYGLTLTSAASIWQNLLLTGDIQMKYVPAGEEAVQIFKASGQKNIIDLGIVIKPLSTVAERQQMMMEIAQLKESRRANGGKGGISAADYLLLSSIIKMGNIPLAQMVMAQLEAKQMQEDLEISQINVEAQGEEVRKTSEAAHAVKMAEINAEGEWELKKVITAEEEKRKTIAFERGLPPPMEAPPAQNVSPI